MYIFHLAISKTEAHLSLLKEGTAVLEKSWVESRDMGRQLFSAIHETLKEQGLKPSNIADFQVKTDVSDNFTSVKIAQTVAQVYTWAVSFESSQKNK